VQHRTAPERQQEWILWLGDRQHRFPESGSRDALCELIDSNVVTTTVWADRLELRTDRTQILELPLGFHSRTLPDGRALPEVVHLVPADRRGVLDTARMFIW
jgi:hypothetical protein